MPATKKKTVPTKTASTKKHSPAHSASVATKQPISEAPKANVRPFPPPAHTALSVLSHIVEATNGPEGFTYMPVAALELLHTDAIEVNEGLRNSQNHVAVRATKAGMKLLAEMSQPNQPETARQPDFGEQLVKMPFAPATAQDPGARALATQGVTVTRPDMAAVGAGAIMGGVNVALTPDGIAIETDVPPPVDINSNRRSRYPFDSLQVGHSFFIANTKEVPNQRKRLASSVANANKKYREQDIKFVVRDGVHPALGAGARVHRVS